jgi:hypothetical protein
VEDGVCGKISKGLRYCCLLLGSMKSQNSNGKGRTTEIVETCTEGEAVTVLYTVTGLGLAVELCTRGVKFDLVEGDAKSSDDPEVVIKAVEGKKIEVKEEGGMEEVEELTRTAKEDEPLTA